LVAISWVVLMHRDLKPRAGSLNATKEPPVTIKEPWDRKIIQAWPLLVPFIQHRPPRWMRWANALLWRVANLAVIFGVSPLRAVHVARWIERRMLGSRQGIWDFTYLRTAHQLRLIELRLIERAHTEAIVKNFR